MKDEVEIHRLLARYCHSCDDGDFDSLIDLFVDDALILDSLVSRRVTYGASAGPKIEMSFDDFTTLGVWTKPGAEFICIEPWQGVADPAGFQGELRDKPGIVIVAPGSSRHFAMAIALV